MTKEEAELSPVAMLQHKINDFDFSIKMSEDALERSKKSIPQWGAHLAETRLQRQKYVDAIALLQGEKNA